MNLISGRPSVMSIRALSKRDRTIQLLKTHQVTPQDRHRIEGFGKTTPIFPFGNNAPPQDALYGVSLTMWALAPFRPFSNRGIVKG